MNEFKIKIRGKEPVIAGKWFTLFMSNEDMNDIIKTIKSLEELIWLINGVTKTVMYDIKNKKLDSLELCYQL